ncbi:dihydropteroate synthase [Phosphitispora fastidiosa]|uniref:dihydropteroate synthase n=1 Tax=Phosphitispora fastidiosa TaxID=2837202 RepID=UPI001E3CC3E1|nr:dihydropteroate synthase [Phosphitispora fastidiosa]
MFTVRAIRVGDIEEAKKELSLTGADASGVNIMSPKAVHRVIKAVGVPVKAAVILKQEMLSKGGEAAVSRGVGNFSVETTDVLLMGTVEQFNRVIKKLKAQPFGLSKLADILCRTLNNLEGNNHQALNCRGHLLPLGERTIIMGILNITPDSFSDGGRFFDLDTAIKHAREMVELGADIIDIGGESTRPTADPVPLDAELSRVLPVLKRLVEEINVPVSVDTYKAEVARQALEEGAHIINDIWGLQADPDMADVVARYEDVPLVLMHNQNGTEYNSMMDEVLDALRSSVDMALRAGVKRENIVIDPGIGFGKDTDQNLEVMHRMWEFKTLGYPVLLGTSRKSMIGNTLNLPVTERIEGTAATVTLGIMQGVDIVRVHDIKEMGRVVRMTDAMVRR